MNNNIIDMNINGARVSHYMDNNHVNHIEIRQNYCIGHGRTFQEAYRDLKNKIIKRTLLKSQEK